MNLQAEDIEFIKTHVAEWLADQSLARPPAVYEVELRERLVRVEETLKHQLILMERGFQLMEKRFEAVDKRFEAVDKRFEESRQDLKAAFEHLTKRTDRFMFWSLGLTFTAFLGVIAAVRYLIQAQAG